jgi:SNF2 family DNA or RNA helicase
LTNIYRFRTRPYRHQVDAIKKLMSSGWGGALLMAPRTGKTKTVIDYASILHQLDEVDRVVVFCPVSVLGVWEEEIARHCPHKKVRITVWDKRYRKKNNMALPKVGMGYLDFVILNYDAMSTPGRITKRTSEGGIAKRSKSRGGRYDVRNKLRAWQPDLMVLDESHRIKSPSAKKSFAIHPFHDTVKYRVIMTGTVVTKKKRIFDIYSQWRFLNRERFPGNFQDFKDKYGRWTMRNGYPQWLKNQNEGDLHKKLHRDSFAITREECYDLPPRLDNELIRVPLEESAKAYDEMAQDMVARIHTGEVTEASIPLVQGLRLQQLTSGIAKTEPTVEHPRGRLVRVGREKLRVLEDRLEDFFEADEKVVIAAKFVADLDAIVALCKRMKIPVWLLRGGMKREDRDKACREFQAHEGAAAFVMQPQAGSLGIDLSTAGTFIWYSLISSYVDYTQAEDRIALNPRGTRFIYLLGADTYDEILYETLQGDGEVARAIMRSPESILRERG